ncbi:MAG: alpha-2-macroglobulin, partial [Bacteroidetes bacterium]
MDGRHIAPVMMERVADSVPPAARKRAAGRDTAEAPETFSVSNRPEEKPEDSEAEPETDLSNMDVRTNLNETVFFFPTLRTDEQGNVVIRFKMNEALTKWKFLGLAHTKDLKIGLTSREIVTQKDLMVQPNPPRFFRENDEIEFTAKVVNLSDRKLSGKAGLDLQNPLTGAPVFDQKLPTINYEIEPGQSFPLSWRFKVPESADVPMIEHTVWAQSGDYSDAERSAVPVLTNRMLVTETMPVPVSGKSEKTVVFDRLVNAQSTTLRHHALTLEFTQNPAWYAVQALPYLMEYPYECTEQIFSRFYANALATSVTKAHPKVKAVFDRWRDFEPEALTSNLSKNEALKTALLEETPWVLQAQSEALQKKNIALLFDLNRMSYEQEIALAKLADRQLANGGWAWFPGGRDNWYITQYIVEGLGHLDRLGVRDIWEDETLNRAVKQAVRYCDDRVTEAYEDLRDRVESGRANWEDNHLSPLLIHYLYARSYFLEKADDRADVTGQPPRAGKNFIKLENKAKTAFDYYLGQAQKFVLDFGLYEQGMMTLAFHRLAKKADADKMVQSFKERALHHEELGMYWKYSNGYFWNQMPLETHALMIEVFEEVARDPAAVNELKIWLLKNKQTNHWKTTKSTAAAVYALLMSGDNWLADDQPLVFRSKDAQWQAEVVNAQKNAEAGTGYFKIRVDGKNITAATGEISVENPNEHPAWGAMYWQYFEDLDKITTFEKTPLTLKKQLFKVENSPTGEVL